jgi:hypothetical protein
VTFHQAEIGHVVTHLFLCGISISGCVALVVVGVDVLVAVGALLQEVKASKPTKEVAKAKE